jgi:sulfite reductase (NADPH) flavoprotein alpha-component
MKLDVKTLCPYCGVGCGIIARTNGTRMLWVRGDPDHPANFGKLCQKGATVAQTVHAPTRLHYPMIRDERGKPAVVSTSAAVDHVARKLEQILQTDGPGAIAFYLSGQLTTEAQYLANKFAKACLRTNHVDSNSRLCMASASSGMKLSLGSDGPPTCYADIDLADTFLFVGSNAAECHPILFDRVAKRVRKGQAKCIVVDPRRTPTCDIAHEHLAIRSGTDLTLINGLLRRMRGAGKLDKHFIANHTEKWDELKALLDEYPAERVVEECGIAMEQMLRVTQMLMDCDRLISFWTMGVNQTLTGTFTSNAIINLHLASGMIGKPGCGPFSLTGQPNAMGGRDCGYMSHTLPGQRFIENDSDRAGMERVWKLRPGHIQPRAGYDAVSMFDALARKEIRAIWIIGSNPAASMPNLPRVREGLRHADLVIVQDAYSPTETTEFAHVILPAAVNFEQTGVFCNSERRVTLMEQVIPPPAQAKPDWWWVSTIAGEMGFTSQMQFNSSAEIFQEFAQSTAGRPNDQSGLSHELLRFRGPQQWPFPSGGASQERRYADGKFPTASGKARFWARRAEELAERVNPEFPLVLTTGRLLNQWHTRTKTGLVSNFNKRGDTNVVTVNPADARSLSLCDGEFITVQSRRGISRGKLRCDDRIPAGTVFMPIHWNELFAPQASPNEVTADHTDPISRQPALKYCAVRLHRATNEPDEH